mmetsp:Transcript_482/g.1403  ORF Transcript_482/g.1403 Transcript_482/m.1403 type:complete len:202 (-) Transcript_482:71-676(-)
MAHIQKADAPVCRAAEGRAHARVRQREDNVLRGHDLYDATTALQEGQLQVLVPLGVVRIEFLRHTHVAEALLTAGTREARPRRARACTRQLTPQQLGRRVARTRAVPLPLAQQPPHATTAWRAHFAISPPHYAVRPRLRPQARPARRDTLRPGACSHHLRPLPAAAARAACGLAAALRLPTHAARRRRHALAPCRELLPCA